MFVVDISKAAAWNSETVCSYVEIRHQAPPQQSPGHNQSYTWEMFVFLGPGCPEIVSDVYS